MHYGNLALWEINACPLFADKPNDAVLIRQKSALYPLTNHQVNRSLLISFLETFHYEPYAAFLYLSFYKFFCAFSNLDTLDSQQIFYKYQLY